MLALFFRPIGATLDVEKPCKMTIWLQKSVLKQPRTSLPKFLGNIMFMGGSIMAAAGVITAEQ